MSSDNPILQRYRDDGFYVARGLLPVSDVVRVRDSILKSFADQLGRSDPPETYSDALLFELMQALFQSDLNKYKKLVAALWRKLDVYQLMHHPKIVAFLQEQFGWNDIFVPGGQIVLIMSHELRIQDGYFGVSAHQDFPSVQGSLDGLVVWLPLMKIDAGNFPLEVIPKSHLKGLLPTVADEKAMWQLESGSYRDEDFVKLCAEPGDEIHGAARRVADHEPDRPRRIGLRRRRRSPSRDSDQHCQNDAHQAQHLANSLASFFRIHARFPIDYRGIRGTPLSQPGHPPVQRPKLDTIRLVARRRAIA